MKHPKFFALGVVLFVLTALMPIANSLLAQTYPDHRAAIAFTFFVLGVGMFLGSFASFMYAFGGTE